MYIITSISNHVRHSTEILHISIYVFTTDYKDVTLLFLTQKYNTSLRMYNQWTKQLPNNNN